MVWLPLEVCHWLPKESFLLFINNKCLFWVFSVSIWPYHILNSIPLICFYWMTYVYFAIIFLSLIYCWKFWYRAFFCWCMFYCRVKFTNFAFSTNSSLEASFTSKATLVVDDQISITKRDEIALPLKLCNLFDEISVTLAFRRKLQYFFISSINAALNIGRHPHVTISLNAECK